MPDPIEVGCQVASGGFLDVLPGGGSGQDAEAEICERIADETRKVMDKAWKAVWDSVLGDVVRAAANVVR